MNPPLHPLLDEAQACKILCACPRTLRELRKSGALPFVLIGRAVRYTIPDLHAFIESRRTWDAPAPAPRRQQPRRPSSVVDFETARAKVSRK
jgi:hypothetical protein